MHIFPLYRGQQNMLMDVMNQRINVVMNEIFVLFCPPHIYDKIDSIILGNQHFVKTNYFSMVLGFIKYPITFR